MAESWGRSLPILARATKYFFLLAIWQYRLWSFQAGDTKLERFLHKNQQTQRKYWNLSFGLMSKIGHHISNKVNNKKCAPKLIFFNEKKLRRIRIIFYIENWLWKPNLGTFWQLAVNPKLKILKISFGYVDSNAKTFLILYPPFEKSTTRIAITRNNT